MKTIDIIYIDAEFVASHGREPLVLLDLPTEQAGTTVILADEVDARRAIAAAKAAYPGFSRATREQCVVWLRRLHDDVAVAKQDIVDVMIAEYRGTTAMAQGTAPRARPPRSRSRAASSPAMPSSARSAAPAWCGHRQDFIHRLDRGQ